MTTPLFQPEEYKSPRYPKGYFKGKKRPSDSDDDVKRFVVADIMPDIKDWFESDWDLQDEDEIFDQLFDVINGYSDGYEMARDLERYGWEPNSALVEILDGINTFDVLRDATSAWREDNNIEPRFEVGAKVKASEHSRSKNVYDGEVVTVDQARAQYTVRIPALGHIERGAGKSGTIGLCLNWEDVEALNPAEGS